jgi:hypothetical protein
MTPSEKGHQLVTGAAEELIRWARRTLPPIEAPDRTLQQSDGRPIAAPL